MERYLKQSDVELYLKMYADHIHCNGDFTEAEAVMNFIPKLQDIDSHEVVFKETHESCLKDLETLRNLVMGLWVDCDAVCVALNIPFTDAMSYFDFGRMAYWNPAPLNGQRIVTKFRLSQKSIRPAKAFEDQEVATPHE